jgi:ASC-1-like (ASCH) protein
MPNCNKIPDFNPDRLFVPLSSEPYNWFKNGRKKWELRTYGQGFTEDHVYYNRHVELRKGYSTDQSIWGKIEYVVIQESFKDILDTIPYYEIFPEATSNKEAQEQFKNIIDQRMTESQLIAFKVNDNVGEIELDPKHIKKVVRREKSTTIRLGHRDYKKGPAILNSKGTYVPIYINELNHTKRSQLSKDDAIRDGFSSVRELQSALEKYYPQIKKDSPVTIVKFDARIN